MNRAGGKVPRWQVPFYAVWGLVKLAWSFITGRHWKGVD